MKWISVTDRLPEKGQHVLTFIADSIAEPIQVGEYTGDTYNPWTFDDCGSCSGITHWMPLPEPPQ